MPEPCFLGVDIGGTKVLAVLTDADGSPLAEHLEATDTAGGEALANQILSISQRLGTGRTLAGIGIGLPASVDPLTHALTLIPNIADMEGTHFHDLLKQRFSQVVTLENDVNAAALAEAHGAEKDDPLAFVAIGTGIGMGLVIDGQLVRGRAGAAGEIAMLPLGGDPREAKLKSSGALESRLGGSGWRAAYQAAGGTAKSDLAALFAMPDPPFLDVIEDQADLLAQALVAIIAVVAPQKFIFGGSIGGQPLLLEAVERRLKDYLISPPQLRASNWGNRAGAIGAALAATHAVSRRT